MPAENGLPQYVSRHAKTGLYQYYRRPPTGLKCPAFVRSFGTKDRKVMMAKYAAVHAEAEAYFERHRTGRTLTDQELFGIAMTHKNLDSLFRERAGQMNDPEDWDDFINEFGTDQMRALDKPDRDRLLIMLNGLYASSQALHLEVARAKFEDEQVYFKGRFDQTPASPTGLTLMKAFETAWKPAADRSKNTVVEVGRYVDEFISLNGELDLKDYTRDHWGAWRADCLEKHGPGSTAFKRFSMMKTICNEAIRAGLFERKFFTGQDVTMKKPKSKKLRNEGWLQDELKEFFSAPVFKGVKDGQHPDADYWVAVIIAYTGARLSEVTGMTVPDVAERHGMWTFFLAKERGKTEDSRRIIPIPRAIIALGFMAYLKTRPKTGPLFEGISPKLMSQTYSRIRADVGITRKGADIHAFRHHMKTLLDDVGASDRVNDYITGHAPPNVGGRYGKTLYANCQKFLDQIDLGVTIPNWKRA